MANSTSTHLTIDGKTPWCGTPHKRAPLLTQVYAQVNCYRCRGDIAKGGRGQLLIELSAPEHPSAEALALIRELADMGCVHGNVLDDARKNVATRRAQLRFDEERAHLIERAFMKAGLPTVQREQSTTDTLRVMAADEGEPLAAHAQRTLDRIGIESRKGFCDKQHAGLCDDPFCYNRSGSY